MESRLVPVELESSKEQDVSVVLLITVWVSGWCFLRLLLSFPRSASGWGPGHSNPPAFHQQQSVRLHLSPVSATSGDNLASAPSHLLTSLPCANSLRSFHPYLTYSLQSWTSSSLLQEIGFSSSQLVLRACSCVATMCSGLGSSHIIFRVVNGTKQSNFIWSFSAMLVDCVVLPNLSGRFVLWSNSCVYLLLFDNTARPTEKAEKPEPSAAG